MKQYIVIYGGDFCVVQAANLKEAVEKAKIQSLDALLPIKIYKVAKAYRVQVENKRKINCTESLP